MKNFQLLIIIILIILVIIYWDKIKSLFNSEGAKCVYAFEPAYIEGVIVNGKCTQKSATPTPKEGEPCVTSQQQNGTWQSGVCVANIQPQPQPQPSNQLEVTNPNGAGIYYQQYINTTVPSYKLATTLQPLILGTKFNYVKKWQDTSAYGKFFYETTIQTPSGKAFFHSDDLKTI